MNLQEYEIEVDRLKARIDHLKSQNDVLSLGLSESKSHCEHLIFLMGKYESKATGLQLTITTLYMLVESLEVVGGFILIKAILT